jgi:pimeloyl-ACP methyl ester carboxylesterase
MKLLLLSGLGADGRLFRELRTPGVELATPGHLEPLEGEAMSAYARRVADRHGVTEEMAVGGASFGGFVAAEIAAQRPCAGLILIGSAPSSRGIAPALALVEQLSRGAPDAALRMMFQVDPRVVSLVETLSAEHRALLMDMFRRMPVATLRRLAAMVFRWPGAGAPRAPVHRIHGAKDRIIHAARNEVDAMIDGAGHLPTFTHPEAVSRFVVQRLGKGT